VENRSNQPEQIKPVELAILAALIDPTACRFGNSRDALFRALALFEETAVLCEEMAPKTFMERIELLEKDRLSGNSGADRLIEALLNVVRKVPQPVLTLAARDNESDTVRPYLAKKLNLEGKAGKKTWSRVRTVHDNLRLMYVDRANNWNRDNAARIRAHERHEQEQAKRDQREAQERRLPVGLISDGRFRAADGWRDGVTEFEELMSRWKVSRDGMVHHYEIPKAVIDSLVEWKREIRQKGGIKAIRPLTRKEVLGKAVEKKNPKRRT
jgi:hypothetical protein